MVNTVKITGTLRQEDYNPAEAVECDDCNKTIRENDLATVLVDRISRSASIIHTRCLHRRMGIYESTKKKED